MSYLLPYYGSTLVIASSQSSEPSSSSFSLSQLAIVFKFIKLYQNKELRLISQRLAVTARAERVVTIVPLRLQHRGSESESIASFIDTVRDRGHC